MSYTRMCVRMFCLHCQIFLQQNSMLIKVSSKTMKSHFSGLVERVTDLCLKAVKSENVIIVLPKSFVLDAWLLDEANLIWQQTYCMFVFAFFLFYDNKCPTVEFIRGWLEYSAPCFTVIAKTFTDKLNLCYSKAIVAFQNLCLLFSTKCVNWNS